MCSHIPSILNYQSQIQTTYDVTIILLMTGKIINTNSQYTYLATKKSRITTWNTKIITIYHNNNQALTI